MEKNLIELKVLDDDDISGVYAVALVEEPAIQVDFYSFDEELFIEPSGTETKDEYVGRCIEHLMTREGYDQDQTAAICYDTWENMAVDVSGLLPYTQPLKKKKKSFGYIEASGSGIEDLILEFASQTGYTEEALKEIFANAALGGGSTFPDELLPGFDEGNEGQIMLYKYEGGISSNSRSFCRQMNAFDKYYTFSDIEAMSSMAVNAGFGPRGTLTYDIWLFKGGANCRHYWSRYFTQYKDGVFRLQKRGRVSGRPGREPYDMPNRGYLLSQMFMDEDEQILVGPAMVPDMEIPRKDKETGDVYFVVFTKETVAKIQEKFMKTQSTHSTNQDHDPNKPADTYIFESWIIEDPDLDKSKKYGFNDLPVGTWMVKMRVNNKKVWERIKKGELKGFSVEGDFIPQSGQK